MNSLPPTVIQGTFGELLVQLRLFQHSVQAAPPIKDSGNDLIGIRGNCFRAIQVKTSGLDPIRFDLSHLPELYHILALVILPAAIHKTNDKDFDVPLDHCRVYLLDKEQVMKGYWRSDKMFEYALSAERVDQLFPLSVNPSSATTANNGPGSTSFPT